MILWFYDIIFFSSIKINNCIIVISLLIISLYIITLDLKIDKLL